MKTLQITLLLLLAFAMTGCDAEPEFSKVTGTVTKNGKPLNRVQVRFVPTDETLGEFIGAGITDDDGNFTIAISGREEDVCCAGECKVTLREAGVPAEIRGQLEQGGGRGAGNMNALQVYEASLKNRPIPKSYERLHSTPLKTNVTPGEYVYPIELSNF